MIVVGKAEVSSADDAVADDGHAAVAVDGDVVVVVVEAEPGNFPPIDVLSPWIPCSC